MPNIMDYLRLQNIFSRPSDMIGNDLPSQGGFSGMLPRTTGDYSTQAISPESIPSIPQTPAIAANPTSGYDVGKRMDELYNPEHTASDRFNTMIGAYPKREDYHPGKLRSLGGMITSVASGFGGPRGDYHFNPQGIAQGQAIQDEPYTDKLSDWSHQIGPAQTAANMERQENINSRSLAYQTVTREQAQQKEEARQGETDRKLKVAEARSKVYDYKSTHQGYSFDFSGPTVVAADKATGKVENTGIPTKHMSDEDKMQLKQEFERENIGSRGAEAANVADVGAKSREKVAEMRGWDVVNIPDPNNPGQNIAVRLNRDTGDVKPLQMGDKPLPAVSRPTSGGSAGNKPDKPSDIKARQYIAAAELFNTRPDLRPFIKLGKASANEFRIMPPSEGLFGHSGPTTQQAAELQKAIYGNTPPQPAASHAPTGASPTTIAQPGRTGGPTGPTGSVGGMTSEGYKLAPKVQPQDEDRVVLYDPKTGKEAASIPRRQAAQAKAQGYWLTPTGK